MRFGAEDPNSRKGHGPKDHNNNIVPQNSNHKDRPQNNDRNSNDRILNHQSRCRQHNRHQHSNRIVEALGFKLEGKRARHCTETKCGARTMLPDPSVQLDSKDVPIPDADDLVIEILTDHVIDFDASSTDMLEIFAVTGGDKEVDERKMTDEDGKLFRREKEAELHSYLDHKVFAVVNETVADRGWVMGTRWVLTWQSTGK